MRLIRSLIKKLILVVIIIMILFYFFQDQILKLALPYIISRNTNVKVKIANVDSEFQKGYINLTGIEVLNPQGFPKETLAKISSLMLDINLKKLLLGKLHLSKFFVDARTIYIIKNEKQELNISKIKKESQKKKTSSKRREIFIEKMCVKLGEIISIDYSQPQPRVRRVRLNIDKEFTNVTDPKKILVPLFTQAIINKSLEGIRQKLRIPDLDIF